MTRRNFLLGKGERLVEDVAGVRGGAPKSHPYTFAEAKNRIAPMLTRVVRGIDQLPDEACPNDVAVAAVTLNPEYIAKSYFPEKLFESLGLEPIGSRPRRIKPEKRSKGREPEEAITTELFVRGPRSAFRAWRSSLPNLAQDAAGAKDLPSIEEVVTPTAREKIKGRLPKKGDVVFEVVLHAGGEGPKGVVTQFKEYLDKIGIHRSLGRRFDAGGLCFVELEAPFDVAERIATFTPVRAVRQMPMLRILRPSFRSSRVPMEAIELPAKGPLDPGIRVAIFDGGIPKAHPITKWAKAIEPPGIGEPWEEFQKHGVGVTSAFLFGHIDPTKPLGRPYAPVDHYRVLDTAPGQDPHELYEVLGRIDGVLVDKKYDLINLSVGPYPPVEDDDVHAWTAVIDDRLSRGDTLATIAVGNNGHLSAKDRLNRIQVPSDCVNAVAVGACDNYEAPWQRCTYSSVGPGRSPGVVKPDFVEFGGTLQRPFIVVHDGVAALALEATEGTSFSAPSVLRLAAGVRAHFGTNLSILAIRALLIHTTEACDYACEDVGRGRVARSVQDIVLCDDDTVRVVYQGKIAPTRYIRAPIPLPSGAIPGKVTITATLCYPTGVDPHHPGNYTRAGLEPTFRPHDQKRKDPKQAHTDSKSFFGKTQSGLMEDELRRDAWKWENCLHTRVTFMGKTLRNPVLDIHYNSRQAGQNFAPKEELPYALVVSVHAKHLGDLYDKVVRKYAKQLEALRPVIEIPVTT